MKNISLNKYYDRNTGKIVNEKTYAGKFLYWSYNTAIGRFLTNLILSRKFVSCIYGWWAKSRFSKEIVNKFVNNMNINTSVDISQYKSFNDFFTRKCDCNSNYKEENQQLCISPADGKILVYENIEPEKIFRIKRNLFSLKSFVKNNSLEQMFANGSIAIIRLCMSDNHYVHFPDSGLPILYYPINGKYYAGGSYSIKNITPFFAENYRNITLFQSDNFGLMTIAEVGAFCVGSIKQYFNLNNIVDSGDEKCRFELGGSTVVMLFQKDRVKFDPDLIENSIKGIETKIHLDEQIGTSQSVSSDTRSLQSINAGTIK